jgi:hypothetical protein
MMGCMSPDEARQFYEEDEDPAKIRALYEAARRSGRLRLTETPPPRPQPMPLGELLAGLVTEVVTDLRRVLRELRLRDRAQIWMSSARTHHRNVP